MSSFFPPPAGGPPPVVNTPQPVSTPLALTILSQDSAGTEEIKVRGMQTLLYVVIKNSPFQIRLSLSRFIKGVDFLSLPLRGELIYDEGAASIDEERTVPFIKTQPLLVKYVESERHTDAECRIKALTSQHEDSNFRIRFTALDPATGEVRSPLLSVLSAPIKVVSKPEQLKNPRKGASYSAALKSSRVSGVHVEQIKMVASAAREQLLLLQGIVRSREERLVAQGRQAEVLPEDDELFPAHYVPPSASAAPPAKTRASKRKRKGAEAPPVQQEKSQFHDPFDASFFRFYAKFSDFDRGSAAEAVRGNVKRLKNAQQESLNAFADQLRVQTLKIQSAGAEEGASVDYCTCADCPHRAKLSTMDSFLSQ